MAKIKKYFISVFIVGGAATLQSVVWEHIEGAPYLLLYPAVILAALYGDGITAIWLCALAAQILFIRPYYSLEITIPRDLVMQAIFIASSYMIRSITVQLSTALAKVKEAENWLSTTLTSIGDAVVATDARGLITMMNPIAEEITQWNLIEAKGRPLHEVFRIVNHTTRQPVENPVDKVLKEGTIVGLANHTVVIGKHGREVAIEDSAAPIRRGEGAKIEGVVLVFRDVTEKMKVERDLLIKSEALENSLNGFDIVNHEGKIIYANKAYLSMWGYDSFEEIKGTSPVGHCADPSTPLKIIQDLKQFGECNIEFLAKRKDGSTFDVHMWARLAHDLDGKEIYPSTSIDITERKKAEDKLKEAVRLRDEFISICSHELKTPITSMKLQFQTAERQLNRGDSRVYSKESVAKRISNSAKQLDRMTRLIEDMLDVSRLNTGKLELNLEEQDLGVLVEEIVDRFSEQFAAIDSPLTVSTLPSVMVAIDRYRIEQVISNLLTNAFKYGGGKPVHVFVERSDHRVKVIVEDQGPGIPKDFISRIFHRFERATSASHVSGLGLGLYISFEIVKMHKGRIWVESELGCGSRFIVELPLASQASAKGDK